MIRLRQFAELFHHQFVRCCYDTCAEIAKKAGALCAQRRDDFGDAINSVTCPLNETASMPVSHGLYWRYLEALAVLSAARVGCADSYVSEVLEAEVLAGSFHDVVKCFWLQEVGEYEGDPYEIPPYGIDLRDTVPWMQAAEALLAQGVAQADALKNLVSRLAIADRPFAPEAGGL